MRSKVGVAKGAKITEGQSEQRHRADRSAAPSRWGRIRSDVLLAIVVALLVVPVLQPLMAQQASRYALTAAVWDAGTVRLDAYDHLLSVDRAERDGHVYSDKAPGQPFLGLPAYALYRALGGHPATEAHLLRDPGLWAVSLLTAAFAGIALALLMRRLALRVVPSRATLAALSLTVGTMLLPFSTVLFSHVMAACTGLAAYLLVTRNRAGPGSLVAAGVVAGTAVTVEYTMVLVVAVVGVVALVVHRWRTGWFVLGGVVPAALLGLYHQAAFGGPLVTGYRYSQFAEHQDGLVGVQPPRPDMLLEVLFSERGLFTLTPLVLVAVVALVFVVIATRGVVRRDAIAAMAVLAAMLFVMGGWTNPTAGASPGPRYVVPALAFLAGGVAWAWLRIPVVTAAATVVGGLAMGLATFTLPLAQRTETFALGHWVWRVAEGRVAATWLTVWTGSAWAILVPIVLAMAVAVWLLIGEARAARLADTPGAYAADRQERAAEDPPGAQEPADPQERAAEDPAVSERAGPAPRHLRQPRTPP